MAAAGPFAVSIAHCAGIANWKGDFADANRDRARIALCQPARPNRLVRLQRLILDGALALIAVNRFAYGLL